MYIHIHTIQIQHLLKLNSKCAFKNSAYSSIQIQHLLKLNEEIINEQIADRIIQIQHLLKLNLLLLLYVSITKHNSNTTLVKVKYDELHFYYKDGEQFKYNTC